MDISIFTDKAAEPDLDDLKNNLDSTFDLWLQIIKIVKEKYPNPKEEWNYPGKKYGWSFRLKDKKNVQSYTYSREKGILKWPLYLVKKQVIELWQVILILQ